MEIILVCYLVGRYVTKMTKHLNYKKYNLLHLTNGDKAFLLCVKKEAHLVSQNVI